ncbi:MAG TPA: DMT family transporter [Chthonomonadaceae bacterium]|nr:DMT family transporter [Chthonomonadaceae bacterium]
MRHYLLLLGGVLAVSAAPLLARWGLDAGMRATTLAMWRLALAASALIAWNLYRAGPARPPLPGPVWIRLAAAGAYLALHFVAWFASLELIPVARSTLLVTTAPLWAGLLGLAVPALRPQRGFWSGLLVAAAGLFLVTASGAARSGLAPAVKGMAPLGDALAVLGAVMVVPYYLLVQQAQARYGTLRVVTVVYAAAALCLGLAALAQGQIALPPTPVAWVSVAGMALVPQLLGHTALNRSLRAFNAGQVAAATLLEPVFAAALAWPLLGERLSLRQALGAALLLGGVALALLHSQMREEVTVPME